MTTARVTFPNGRTATISGADRAAVQGEIDRLTAEMSTPTAAAEPAASKGPSARYSAQNPTAPPSRRTLGGFGTGIRDTMIGVAGTADVLVAPMAAWGNKATDAMGMGTPFATMSGLATQAADSMGLAPASTPTGRVISTVNRTVAGIMAGGAAGGAYVVRQGAPLVSSLFADNLGAQFASGVSGAVAGGLTAEETDDPWAIGAASLAGSFLPGAGVAGYNAVANRTADTTAARMMLAERAGTLETTTDDVQAAVRGDYRRASGAFETEYATLDATARPQYTPPPEVNPVEWGMPIAQDSRNVPASTRAYEAARTRDANIIIGEGLEGTVTRVDRMAQGTVQSMREQRSVLLSQARAPAATPQTRRVLGGMADAIQDDIDDTLLNTAAGTLSRRYNREVIGPYAKVRKGGVLEASSDSSDSWKAIKNAGREDLGRLSVAVSPETREVIRQRTVADIIEQENRFIGLQSGSGAPVWRDFDKKGMGAFFTPDEWRGLQRITGTSAFFKHPATRVGAAVVGGVQGGITGVGLALFGDWLATTTSGRLFMARAGTGSARAARESARTLLANPGTLQAEIQQAKEKRDTEAVE